MKIDKDYEVIITEINKLRQSNWILKQIMMITHSKNEFNRLYAEFEVKYHG